MTVIIPPTDAKIKVINLIAVEGGSLANSTVTIGSDPPRTLTTVPQIVMHLTAGFVEELDINQLSLVS
jgi:hypothetical protein